MPILISTLVKRAVSLRSFQYNPVPKNDDLIIEELKKLIEKHPSI
jgi:hypothetical protein